MEIKPVICTKKGPKNMQFILKSTKYIVYQYGSLSLIKCCMCAQIKQIPSLLILKQHLRLDLFKCFGLLNCLCCEADSPEDHEKYNSYRCNYCFKPNPPYYYEYWNDDGYNIDYLFCDSRCSIYLKGISQEEQHQQVLEEFEKDSSNSE